MSGEGGPRPIERLHILELTQRYPPALGGVERHVERLARELTRAGATVEVVTSDLARDNPFTRGHFAPPAGSVPVRRHRGFLAAPIPHGSGIVVPGMLFDALRTDVDVVHAHAFGHFPMWVGQLVHGLRGIPLVVTPHSDPGTGTTLARLWSRYVARTTIRGADRTVALSHLEASWLRLYGVRADRIRVIPPGIDFAEFETLTNRTTEADGPVILFVGRLEASRKGLEPLVRAMAELPRNLRARLRLVGEDWGGLGPALSLARSLGVADRIDARGAVPRAELLREYASADLFVLPSLFDSFPVVVLEAMAAGVPVVATRVGGVPELLEEGECGLLVPPGNPGALAEALAIGLSESALRERFAREGRRRASQFDWSRIAAQFVNLFEEVTGSRDR
ncbi:MAG: glycosyltransferase family 4 protein [Thermoplasmata archaeon]